MDLASLIEPRRYRDVLAAEKSGSTAAALQIVTIDFMSLKHSQGWLCHRRNGGKACRVDNCPALGRLEIVWKLLGYRIGTRTQSKRCPNCGSASIRRSRRNGVIEKILLKALALHPYRCEECDDRYFRLGMWREPHEQTQTLASGTARASKG
jgi:uncharacterized protein with PIN domain